MNLNGIGSGLAAVRLPQTETRPRVEHDRATQPQATPAAAQVREPLSVTLRANTLPAEAPEGTDPELWAVLTTEERSYFAKVGAMGPLTYGHVLRSGSASNPAMRGGRLDVRA